MRRTTIGAGLLLGALASLAPAVGAQDGAPLPGQVALDLRTGAVRGESAAVVVVAPPRDGDGDGWHEAALRLDLRGRAGVRIEVELDGPPVGFVLNVGDSPSNNGWAGDGAEQSHDAEAQLHEGELAVFGDDDTPAAAALDGSRLLARLPGFAGKGTRLVLTARDGTLEWEVFAPGAPAKAGVVRSPHLFALDGQQDAEGPINWHLHLGLNRVVAGDFRRGSGAGRALITVLD